MEVVIKNGNKEKLYCDLKHNNTNNLFYIIPGEGEHKNQRAYQRISKTISELGYDIIVCDLSAMGKSEGDPSDNSLDKRLNDFLTIHNHFKKKYSKFYFLGFSFGALVGLIASTKIKFEKQFLLSCALFYENRETQNFFLNAWKRLGTLPDWKSFEKGKIKPAKQKLKYKFVASLKKYKIRDICNKVKTETFLVCGDKEYLLKKQNKLIYNNLNSRKHILTINGVGHEIRNKKYIDTIKKLLLNNL